MELEHLRGTLRKCEDFFRDSRDLQTLPKLEMYVKKNLKTSWGSFLGQDLSMQAEKDPQKSRETVL